MNALDVLYRADSSFAQRVDIDGDCLVWRGCLNEKGYGILTRHGKNHRAHRYAFEVVRGPILAGMQLDHLCRVRACVNPAHLEPVTSRENTRRGLNHVAAQMARTECPQGHPYNELNTYVSRGKRYCRTCRRTNVAGGRNTVPDPLPQPPHAVERVGDS